MNSALAPTALRPEVQQTRPTVSVMLPTFRRPEMLRQCLKALMTQTCLPKEVCIGRRVNDAETAAVLAEFAETPPFQVKEAIVGEDGNLIVSMNAALALTTCDLVALTDDDAEAPPDWLERLRDAFSTHAVAGVGGRDIQANAAPQARVVGKLNWCGKLIGNHHIGIGPKREVDFLKGVNCCFRGPLLRCIGFDRRLRGRGNVVHWELALCLGLRRRGLTLIYDPAIYVYHHSAPRGDGDTNNRGGFDRSAFRDLIHNEELCLHEHLTNHQRVLRGLWNLLIGSSSAPGLAAAARELFRGRLAQATVRMRTARLGRHDAVITLAESHAVDKSHPS